MAKSRTDTCRSHSASHPPDLYARDSVATTGKTNNAARTVPLTAEAHQNAVKLMSAEPRSSRLNGSPSVNGPRSNWAAKNISAVEIRLVITDTISLVNHCVRTEQGR